MRTHKLAQVPYREVLTLWGRVITMAAKKMQAPLSRMTKCQRENLIMAANSALVVDRSKREGGVSILLQEERMYAGLQMAGIPFVAMSDKLHPFSYGTIKAQRSVFDAGTRIAQREVVLLGEQQEIVGCLSGLIDEFSRGRGFGNVIASPNLDEKIRLLGTNLGMSEDQNLAMALTAQREKVLGVPVAFSGTLLSTALAIEGMHRLLNESEILERLISQTVAYINRAPYQLQIVLEELGFLLHENGFGPFLFIDQERSLLDEAPLLYYRGRERARRFFIDPGSIAREELKLEEMFTFLREAFTDWFSGRARDFKPIDYRGADELRSRFLQERKDFKPPIESVPEREVLQEFIDTVLPQSSGFPDPRYVSHMASNIPFIALMADWLKSVLNQNVIEQSEASATLTFVEEQLISWIANLIGFDPHVSGGSVVSGGTVANLTALLVARNRAFPGIMEQGYEKMQPMPQGVILVSERAHYSIAKAAGILGIGKEHVLSIPVDGKDRMDISSLRAKIAEMEAEGKKVIAVVGIGGTSETGAIDNLEAIAEICHLNNIWFHVDAAYGGAALTSQNIRERFRGIDRADSATIDGHKWFYVPFEFGMVIFSRRADLALVKHTTAYTIKEEEPDLGKITIEGSRAANALKLWMTLKALGVEGYGYIIDHCIEMADHLQGIVDEHPLLERLTDSDLNFVCFRYVPIELKEALRSAGREKVNQILSRLNEELQLRFKQSGKGFFAFTALHVPGYDDPVGAMRSIIMNPFTSAQILDQIMVDYIAVAEALWQEKKVEILHGIG